MALSKQVSPVPHSNNGPIDIHPIIARGLLWDGVPLSRAVFYDADGNAVSDVTLPPTNCPPVEKDWANTAAGYTILLHLVEYGLPMSGQQIAIGTGYSYSGSFRETLLGLIGQGKISKTPDGLYSVATVCQE